MKSTCTCWVKDAPAETQFCTHYGAHDLDCPVYHESADSVDRKHDRDLNARMHGQGDDSGDPTSVDYLPPAETLRLARSVGVRF